MRLDLFSQEDNVLLLGEGNFSFAKCLVSHNLPIKVTATCLDNGVKYKNQLENIEFLVKKKIPVFLDVDATKLNQHQILKSQVFTKVIFNFPHVGGKMKIQLNRELVRKVCESSCHLLNNGGQLIITLCNGQGGTPDDNPQRKWDDSWQITEMAAYGSFCLTSVEPFDFNNFQYYDCVGYRSQDSHFNVKGALVHVLKKKLSPSRVIDEATVKRLSPAIFPNNSEIFVPFYYSELYSNSPLQNSNSSYSFIQNLLLKQLEKLQWDINVRILNDESIPVAIDCLNGVLCKCDGKYLRLRSSAFHVIDNIAEEYKNSNSQVKVIFFPGMYFNSDLHDDFQKTSPISFQFVLLGANVLVYFKNFLNGLASLFHINEVEIRNRKIFSVYDEVAGSEEVVEEINERISNCVLATEWQLTGNTVAHELHLDYPNANLEAFIIYVDKLIEIIFFTKNWKESWSEDSFVSLDSENIPILKQGLLHPLSYQFDITLRYETDSGLSDDDVYEKLRISAIDMIHAVEMINEYNSGFGWSSKCFRITYQSFNYPLNRSKALDVHKNLISNMLTLSLPVTIN